LAIDFEYKLKSSIIDASLLCLANRVNIYLTVISDSQFNV